MPHHTTPHHTTPHQPKLHQPKLHQPKHPARAALVAIGLLALPLTAHADEHVKLTLKNHRFSPAAVTVAAGQPITIEIDNRDGSAAEFESKSLRVEEVVAANARVTVSISPLTPGRYRFFDDFNEDTTEGFLTAR